MRWLITSHLIKIFTVCNVFLILDWNPCLLQTCPHSRMGKSPLHIFRDERVNWEGLWHEPSNLYFKSSRYGDNLTITTLLANPADNKLIFFLFYPEYRIWHVMQIICFGHNLHEISKTSFLGKNYKYITICHLLKILFRVLSVKIHFYAPACWRQ